MELEAAHNRDFHGLVEVGAKSLSNEDDRVSGHSHRLSGKRFGSRFGASRETVAALGDWRNMALLKRYMSVTGFCQALCQEVGNKDGGEHIEEWSLQNVLKEASSKDAISSEMATVSFRCKPHKWHRIVSDSGPCCDWTLRCGDVFNPTTMTIRKMSEWPESKLLCGVCR